MKILPDLRPIFCAIMAEFFPTLEGYSPPSALSPTPILMKQDQYKQQYLTSYLLAELSSQYHLPRASFVLLKDMDAKIQFEKNRVKMESSIN